MLIKLTKDLSTYRAEAETYVDQQAGQIRLLYVTHAPAQDMVYQEKREEARLVLSGQQYDEADVPHIMREAADSGVTVEKKAHEIVAQANYWKQVSAIIESRRLSAKNAIRQANSEDAIDKAKVIQWNDVMATEIATLNKEI